MLKLTRCLMPTGWTSYPDRPWLGAQNGAIMPEAACLDNVQRMVNQAYWTSGQSKPAKYLNARLQLIQGDMAFAQQSWQNAVSSYEKSADLLNDVPTPHIWAHIAAIYMLYENNPDEALRVTLHALEHSPESAELRIRASEIYLFHSQPPRPSQAIEVLRPLVGRYGNSYAYGLMAVAYLNLGQFDDGIDVAQQAIDLARHEGHDDLANALRLLGSIQRCAGQDKVGKDNLRQALLLAPDMGTAKTALNISTTDLCRLQGQ